MKTLILLSALFFYRPLIAQSWVELSDVPFLDGRYDDVFFINDSQGWCGSANGKIYHTGDGGSTWELQYTTPYTFQYMRAVEFIDAQIGIAGSLEGIHMKTTDGGLNWTEIQEDIPGPVPGLCGFASAGQHFYGVGAFFHPAYFIHSPDAGNTWQWTDMSAYADGLVACHFVNENVGFVGGIRESEGSVILKTTDGGDTWTEVFTSTGGSAYAWKFFQVNALTIYASIESWFAPGTFIAKSIDGGDTWQQYLVSSVATLDIQGIGFENELHGWVGPRNSPLFETIDGGLTWNQGTGPNNINSFFRTAAGTLYASGSYIYKYDDAIGLHESQLIDLPSMVLNPNPVDQSVEVSLEIFQSSQVLLDIFDTEGRLVINLLHERLPVGKVHLSHDLTQLAPGIYHLSLRSNEGFQSIDFVKM